MSQRAACVPQQTGAAACGVVSAEHPLSKQRRNGTIVVLWAMSSQCMIIANKSKKFCFP